MISPECREQLRQERRHALKRYEKHRRRNLLAKPGSHRFVVVLDNLKAGFNVPKVFRSAEAFGAREVHLINIGPFDPAPAKGAFKKVPACFHADFKNCHAELTYTIFVLEPDCESTLGAFPLPQKSAFVLGHEELGISFDKSDYPDLQCLAIAQFGEVQSLNVSVAASIVMYEYVRQHGQHRGHGEQAMGW